MGVCVGARSLRASASGPGRGEQGSTLRCADAAAGTVLPPFPRRPPCCPSPPPSPRSLSRPCPSSRRPLTRPRPRGRGSPPPSA
eukprot:1318788-Prymnesium_polylepis.1